MQIKLSPSILNADFGRLAEQVREAEAAGADYLHIDVMDGQFVPNISLGPAIVQAIRQATTLPLDLHLMIEEPQRFLDEFVEAGASIVTVHAEAVRHLHATIGDIKAAGLRAGVALNPATPLWVVEEIIDQLDLLLIMTVNPGFGGQAFIPETLGKIARARAMLDARAAPAELEVDGGIKASNIGDVVRHGARVVVAGTAIFVGGEGIRANTATLRQRITEAQARGDLTSQSPLRDGQGEQTAKPQLSS